MRDAIYYLDIFSTTLKVVKKEICAGSFRSGVRMPATVQKGREIRRILFHFVLFTNDKPRDIII